MKFSEVVAHALAWLQREGRVSYRALRLEFALPDEELEALKEELIEVKEVAVDKDGKMLVWTGASHAPPVNEAGPTTGFPPSGFRPVPSAEAERRQLTVLFCDLVGSTALSEQLDPEEYREVVRAYQSTCLEAVQRYAGSVTQHLGDGLLIYFGYPTAHEDDAQRAVRAALEMVATVGARCAAPLPTGSQSLQVRIGIHTGLAVIGEVGSSERREILALGETPNLAGRLQGLAQADTVVISTATHRLVAGLFECEDLGAQLLKGLSTPVLVYRVVRESEARSRFEVAVRKGLTPLVGRDLEVGLLRDRWARAQGGAGQVILLSGEAGIGKSRLGQELKEHVSADGAIRIEVRCSPYHQHSAFAPLIEHLQRLLQFTPQEAPHVKLHILRQTLAAYRFPQAATLPLLASLLSLPHPEGVPPLTLSPQKQKQQTQEALVAWIVEEAAKAPVYCAWEDLHWADPSTLEVLTLLLDQVPTTRLLVLLTFRPDFSPPWRAHAHFTQLTLGRLGQPHVEAMVEQVSGGNAVPAEVMQHIVAKTDGVPLFVEELTKMVLESGLLTQRSGHAELSHPLPPLAIPATLQDSLMARLDRLAPVREMAQVGATLGREFSYELMQALSPVDDATLQAGLRQLVEAELVYQRGVPPQATYRFKHALIQEAAYQSLLKSKRQQVHQQVAQVLLERFPETVNIQPELVAHHYTEAGLQAYAIPYWHRAGRQAVQRSANVEAIHHLNTGLALLQALPDMPERAEHELRFQTLLGPAWMAIKGYAAPEVESAYTRALELCQQMGETPQLFPVLSGLSRFAYVRAELQTARTLGEQCVRLSHTAQDPALLIEAHRLLGATFCYLGELTSARAHLEQSVAQYDPQQHRAMALLYGTDPRVASLCYLSNLLWCLGYPEQALQKSQESLTVATERAHLISLAGAWHFAAVVHQCCREGRAAQTRAEAAMTLSREQGFAFFAALGTIDRGGALAEQGQGEEGIAQMQQGLTAYRATGAELFRPYFLALLAGAYRKAGQVENGLTTLTEALTEVDKTGERFYEAELYRLKGELTLQWRTLSSQSQREEAEACFQNAIAIACRQHAKSLELRAGMSVCRLWQRQGKRQAAHTLLSEIYGWFTEGFETRDLQDAQALLRELT